MFSVVSVVFVGLLGCRTPGPIANHSDLAQSPGPDDPAKVCPDICGVGTLCRLPDGSCTEVCNPCYCTREGGTVVEACPKADATPREFQTTAVPVMAVSDGVRAR
jgi:hypothetical protein